MMLGLNDRHSMTSRLLRAAIAVALISFLFPGVTSAQTRRPAKLSLPGGVVPVVAPAAQSPASVADPVVEAAVEQLRSAFPSSPPSPGVAPGERRSVDDLNVVRTTEGYARALSAPAGRAFALPRGVSAADPGSAAVAFVQANRVALGVSGRGVRFREDRSRAAKRRHYVRLRQEFQGIPIFGAAMIVQLGPDGGVEFLLSDVARDKAEMHSADFDVQPTVSAGEAPSAALSAVPATGGAPDLVISDPVLMIYEPSVIGNAGPSRLVWHVRLTSEVAMVDHVVLVDAHTGEVAFHFSQVMEARNRQIYDSANVPDSLGTLRRSEGQAPYGLTDVDLAYDYVGDTYDFYSSVLGRDSVNGAGMALVMRVRYCDSGSSCPYANAFWNGSEMRFGQGYAAADDVVAHEYTHGVTDYESDLIYWGESGAINESFSDIFGEFVDLTNGRGTDTSGVRWLMGEDAPGGAMRSMSNPPAYGDPDRRFSSNWWTAWSDSRGVHINSGVGNKLAYLLTDGASFNGQTITGQGITSVAGLFYEAQANLLVPGSDYNDLFLALRRAALNVGWSITARQELDEAGQAVEIDVPANATNIFTDGFEGAWPGSWQIIDGTGVGTKWGRSTAYFSSGSRSAWCAGGGANASPPGGNYKPDMNTWMVFGPFSLADATHAWAEFDLLALVEDGYDAGFWGVSTDGTNFSGWYLSPSETDGLVIGPPNGFVHEKFDFRAYAGESQVWFAFAFMSDSSVQYDGVYIDNVGIRKAGARAPFGTFDTPANNATGLTGNVAVTGWALDDVGVSKVEIYRDPVSGETPGPNGKVYIGDANFVPGARPDIDAAYPEYPSSWRAGWGYMMLTNFLPNSGNGTFKIYAYAVDTSGQSTLLGSKTITCSNATATKPFGTIDTPGQGQTISGVIQQWGWALTPQTATIPIDGSTIWVYVDGTPLGHPVYNLYRADIGTLFPGYANTSGAVGYFVLDTTTLSNGMHSIAWSVTDDQGRTDGIGSRFFWVEN